MPKEHAQDRRIRAEDHDLSRVRTVDARRNQGPDLDPDQGTNRTSRQSHENRDRDRANVPALEARTARVGRDRGRSTDRVQNADRVRSADRVRVADDRIVTDDHDPLAAAGVRGHTDIEIPNTTQVVFLCWLF